jgi:branched-chain amino acid transport system ATP-binding protein
MLEVQQVNVHYGDIQALWDVSLRVAEGEIVSLVGSNGAGKTTILKTIAGILRPSQGTVSIGGIQSNTVKAHQIVELGVSLVPEGRKLFRDMTVIENLEMGGFIDRARPKQAETLKWIHSLFPILASRAHQLAGTLSGGEQQMVAIARALMSQPKYLLVDELSLGLAPLIVTNIYDTLKEINRTRKMAILVVEQNVRLALKIADRGYIMENGRITAEGSGSDLLNSNEIKNAYLAMG